MKTLFLSLLLLTPILALAQAGQQDTSMRELLEAQERGEAVMEQASADGDTLDMSSPLSSLLLLKDALGREDYERAAEFLDMRYLPQEMEGTQAAQLLQQLRYVWGRQEILDISRLSDRPEGHLKDGLPEYRDQIGSISLSTGVVPVYMQRVPDGKGARVWKISNATVASIPQMWAELGYSPLAAYAKSHLPEFEFKGLDNWQVVFIVLVVLLSWPLASLICILLAKFFVHRTGPFQDAIARFLRFQFRIFVFIMLGRFAFQEMGLSLKALILIRSAGIMYVAVIILLLGLINLLHGYQARRLMQAGNEHYVALLKPIATMMKVLVVISVCLVWADDAGYDMSTIIAGLGVGSLAVALAAQKTLENVIGAITIYTARPIKPGDFCRFGTTVGVVEEIGLRSTILRTLNRTLVSIPNAVFAADQVENYSDRDRIRYFRELRLEISSAEVLNDILEKLRQLFAGHEKLMQDSISIRFDQIADNTANVRIDAGVMTTDFQEYLEIAEGLNLEVIDLVQSVGGRFCGPGRQVTLHGTDDGWLPDSLEQFLADQQGVGETGKS